MGGPGGAPEDAGGVGGGGHGADLFVPLGDGYVLGFVTLEEGGGGGADDVGGGRAGEEEDAGGAVAVDVALFFFPGAAGEVVALEDALEAAHGVEGLGLPGGGDFDDLGVVEVKDGEEVGFDLRLELVLAGLAGKDDDEGEAAAVEDGVDDGLGDFELVGAEGEVEVVGAEGGDIAEEGGEDGGERHG